MSMFGHLTLPYHIIDLQSALYQFLLLTKLSKFSIFEILFV
jgi:hypothetical protein